MMLDWCEKCKNRCVDEEHIYLPCLACKWQYVGQSAFKNKADLFEDDQNSPCLTPYQYFSLDLARIATFQA